MLQADQVLQKRYQLKQKLGHNAGRQTWLAEDLQSSPSESVVIKLLTFGGDAQWDDLKLFEREADTLKQLNHHCIPKYRDYFSVDDRALWFGLVQDYIPGASFKTLLKKGVRFTESEIKAIATAILETLIYLHRLNPPLIHRDIKPSNLIFGKDGKIYIVDFGAVQNKAFKEGETFTIVGTYGYTPMEQFGGRAVPASDLYALGATLVYLLTGNEPANLPQKDGHIDFQKYTSASLNFVNWVETLIEPLVEKRFKTASEALKALKYPSTSSLTISRKPVGSEIVLVKSTQQIKVKIPKKFGSQRPFITCILIFLFYLIPQFLFQSNPSGLLMYSRVWLFAIIPALVGWCFCITLECIYFQCDKQTFEIGHELFGLHFRKQRGQTKDISKVTIIESWPLFWAHDPRKMGIKIVMGVKQYPLLVQLAPTECHWLIGELKGWLKL